MLVCMATSYCFRSDWEQLSDWIHECGNGPNLVLEVIYKDNQVKKYRTVVQEDGTASPTESDWVE